MSFQPHYKEDDGQGKFTKVRPYFAKSTTTSKCVPYLYENVFIFDTNLLDVSPVED